MSENIAENAELSVNRAKNARVADNIAENARACQRSARRHSVGRRLNPLAQGHKIDHNSNHCGTVVGPYSYAKIFLHLVSIIQGWASVLFKRTKRSCVLFRCL